MPVLCALLFSMPSPARGITVNPLLYEAGDGYLRVSDVWASAGWYPGSRGLSFSIRMGGFLELARWGGNSVAIVASSEVLASAPGGIISFHPLAARWEEGLLVTGPTGEAFWQAGFLHSCKHDVDTTRRILVGTRLLGGMLCEHAQAFVHLYVYATDYPEAREGKLLFSLEGTGSWKTDGDQGVSADGGLRLFGYRDGLGLDARAGAGGFTTGAGASMAGFFEYERVHDVGLYGNPAGMNLFQLGLRALGPRGFF